MEYMNYFNMLSLWQDTDLKLSVSDKAIFEKQKRETAIAIINMN